MCFVTFGPKKQFKFESNEVFFVPVQFLFLNKHPETSSNESQNNETRQKTADCLTRTKKIKLNCRYFPNITLFSSRWAPGALVSAVIKPVTSWFWRAASLLISIPKRRHKGACRSFFLNTSDCWGGKSAMMLKHRMRLCICFHPRATPLWTERDETDAAHLKDYNWLSRAAVRAQICQRDSAALRNAESYDILQ